MARQRLAGVRAGRQRPCRKMTAVPAARASDVRSVRRALALLALMARSDRSLTLSQIARAAELPVATASRLLATLVGEGFAERAVDGCYRPGAHAARVGLAALQRYGAFRLSDGHLAVLVKASGETANLSVRVNDDQAIYLRQLSGPRAFRHASWAGTFIPLRGTACGAALRGELGSLGFAVMRHEAAIGFTALAAPVYGVGGVVAAALGISGPTPRIGDADIERLGRLVVRQARAASAELISLDS